MICIFLQCMSASLNDKQNRKRDERKERSNGFHPHSKHSLVGIPSREDYYDREIVHSARGEDAFE